MGVASATGLGLQQHNPMPGLMADYRSPVGQRRRMGLEDGSVLQLNTRSAADVRFDGQQRRVRLFEGELALQVASDARPLLLRTGEGALRLDSGRFNVRQFDGYSLVSVFEGWPALQGNRYWLGSRHASRVPGGRLLRSTAMWAPGSTACWWPRRCAWRISWQSLGAIATGSWGAASGSPTCASPGRIRWMTVSASCKCWR